MKNSKSENVILISVTQQELASLFKETIKDSIKEILHKNSTINKRYVYGLKGLSELLNISYQSAFNIRKSGKLDRATKKIGQKLMFDIEIVMEEISKNPVR